MVPFSVTWLSVSSLPYSTAPLAISVYDATRGNPSSTLTRSADDEIVVRVPAVEAVEAVEAAARTAAGPAVTPVAHRDSATRSAGRRMGGLRLGAMKNGT